MFRKFLLPLLALAGFTFAMVRVVKGSAPVPVSAPVAEPARAPFENLIAGAGIVEARSQNVAVGTPVNATVEEVLVVVGQRVQRGQALFRLDSRQIQAELGIRNANLNAKRARLAELEALPRAEDLPPARARVREAQLRLEDAERLLELAQSVGDPRAISTDDLLRRGQEVRAADSRLELMRADLALLEAGTFGPELEVARAEIAAAEAQVAWAQSELDRHQVRAPLDATVLQVNLRAGEFAQSGAQAANALPLVLLGDLSALHVRIDIDENDAWRFTPGAEARAFVRGNAKLSTSLSFVRIDPYVIPKRSLTGESNERVDTRVLQVLYSFDPATLPVYVGQQMDVFINAQTTAEKGQ